MGNPNRPETITWKACLRLAVCALAVFLCVHYWSAVEGGFGLFFNAVAAILAGVAIAYVANIPMRFFERVLPGGKGDGTANRTAALALSVLSVVAVLLFVGLLVVPQLVSCVVALAKEAPSTVSAIADNDVVKSLLPADLGYQLKNIDWGKVVGDAASWLQSGVVSSLPQIASLFSQVAAWFMGIVFAFWFLGEKDRLAAQGHRLLRDYVGEAADARWSRATALVDDCFHRYIVAQCLEALILGSLVAIGMAVCQLPYAPMVGALVGVMSLIPMVGAPVGAVLGAFMILSASWQQALVFLAVFFVVQQIESNFIYARVVGKRVGLSGMWPLIGVTLGGAFFGIAGAFVGVPVTAAAFRIVEGDLDRREQLGAPTPLERLHDSLAD